MHVKQITLCLSALLACVQAVPRDYETPEAFKREILTVGGVSKAEISFGGQRLITPLVYRIVISPGLVVFPMVSTLGSV